MSNAKPAEPMEGLPEFMGRCFGVKIHSRIGYAPLIVICREDDDNWFEGDSFDAYWLDELIDLLKRARRQVERQK